MYVLKAKKLRVNLDVNLIGTWQLQKRKKKTLFFLVTFLSL